MNKFEKLLSYIVEEYVDNVDEIKINTVEKGNSLILKVRVAEGELGKVIGKNGITANAIRGVMQAAGVKDKLNINVEFLD